MTEEKGINIVVLMRHEEIANIPCKKVVTYTQVVLDYWEQKEDPYQIRITAGCNLI